MNKKTNQKRCVAILMAVILPMSFVACKGKKAGNLSDTSLDRELNIGIMGDACELHFYAAQMLGLYEKAGYKVNWIHTNSSNLQMQLVSGKIDASDGVLHFWLKAIEQGLDVKISTGLQQGCIGYVVLPDAPYRTLADLKGKKIGEMVGFTIGSSYIWGLLIKQGFDPLSDYEWVSVDDAAAFIALEKGEIDALDMPDTFSWPLVAQGQAKYVSRMATAPELADQTCCVLALSPKFVEQYPGAAKKLTEILYEAAVYTETHKREVVQYGYDSGLILNGTVEESVGLTADYTWNPGYEIAEYTFRSIFKDYQSAGIIDESISVDKVVDRVFIKFDGIR